MEPLWECLDFVRKVRFRARFGKLSRAPLRMLRLELSGETAECDLMARPPDPWDVNLPPAVRERNVSFRCLQESSKSCTVRGNGARAPAFFYPREPSVV